MQEMMQAGLTGVALATALVAGVFLTFSDFLMRSLRRASPAAGAEAMQVLNREVYASVFMVLLLGLVPVTALLGAYGAWAGRPLLMAGAGAYLLGVFAVTAAGNVPMNKRLDALPTGGPEAQRYWPTYVRGWLRWNHLRSLSATASAAAFAAAAVAG